LFENLKKLKLKLNKKSDKKKLRSYCWTLIMGIVYIGTII